MNRLRLRAEGGFTLIELLVVIAIIGILAALAIPQFAAYRRRGYESDVKSNLKNAATAQEAYFVNANTYKNCTGCTGSNLTGFNASANVKVNTGGGAQAFELTATHGNCKSTDVWTFQSTGGSLSSPAAGCSQ